MEKTQAQTKAQSNYNRRQRREFSCYKSDKRGHKAWDCRGPKKNKGRDEDDEDISGDDCEMQQQT